MRNETSSWDKAPLRDSLLVLRYARLEHLPPALYETQILVEQGAPVLIVEYGKASEDPVSEDPIGVRRRISNRWVRFLPSAFRNAAIFAGTFFQVAYRILRSGRPKLILAHGLSEKVLAIFLHRLFQIPIAIHEHEIYDPSELTGINRVLFLLGVNALHRAKFIIFPGTVRAELYRDRYGLDRTIHIVYNCPRRKIEATHVDLRARLGLPASSILLGYFGGLGHANALEEAITSLIEVPRVHLLLLGWATKEFRNELRELARKMGVENRVHFLGVWKNRWELIQNCDLSYCVYRPLYLRLKYAATSSNKLMESMAAGIPVITSGERDFREIVENERVGLCLNEITSSEVARVLKTLVADPILRRRMSENGRRLFRSHFNYETQFAPVMSEFSAFFPNLPNFLTA